MQVSFAGFGLEFTFEEAKQFVQALSGVVHKDKKYVCLLLNFSFVLLQDYYNEASRVFIPAVVKRSLRDLSDEKKEGIYEFMRQSKYVPVVDTL